MRHNRATRQIALRERERLSLVLRTIVDRSQTDHFPGEPGCTVKSVVDALIGDPEFAPSTARWFDRRLAERRFSSARVKKDAAILADMGCVRLQELPGRPMRAVPVCTDLKDAKPGERPHLTPAEIQVLNAALSEIISLHFVHGRCLLQRPRDLDLLDCLGGLSREEVEVILGRLAHLGAVHVVQDGDLVRIVPLRGRVEEAA
jgi:hypothetical protein